MGFADEISVWWNYEVVNALFRGGDGIAPTSVPLLEVARVIDLMIPMSLCVLSGIAVMLTFVLVEYRRW
ncbi:MAG: hypothetical protein WAW81_03410 [Minisyncoccia bacterium]